MRNTKIVWMALAAMIVAGNAGAWAGERMTEAGVQDSFADDRRADQLNSQDTQHSGAADRTVMSLLGEELKPAPIPDDRRAKLEEDLAKAKAAYEADPTDVEAIIWYGRRLAYLGRYREAIDVYTAGIVNGPPNPKLFRHRGHRFISIRKLDWAEADLTRAAELIERIDDEIEPDGQPNAAGIPTSTLHTNIWYHLGLAQFLLGRFEESRDSYAKCFAISGNDDMRVAASYWLYLNNKRLGDEAGARAVLGSVSADMNIIENETYQRLLLLFKGNIKPEDVPGTQESAVGEAVDDATMAYGVAMWHMFNGRKDEAHAMFERIAGKDRAEDAAWAAFGYIAAEAELARAKENVDESRSQNAESSDGG